MPRRLTAAIVLLMAGGLAAYAQSPSPPSDGRETQTLNLSAYAELLRADVRAQKVAIITEVMGFTETEDAAFWPLYREYDRDMSKLGDERVALITDYTSHYSTLTDADAERIAKGALDLDARRQALRAAFYERVRGALPPRTALRFLQVDHQLQLLIDLQIAALLPVAR